MAKAKIKYKEIIGDLTEFEKGDRFQMNIVDYAMLAAVILNIPSRPDVGWLTHLIADIIYYCNNEFRYALD